MSVTSGTKIMMMLTPTAGRNFNLKVFAQDVSDIRRKNQDGECGD